MSLNNIPPTYNIHLWATWQTLKLGSLTVTLRKKTTTIFYKVQLLWTSLRSSSDRNIAKLSQSPILCYSFKLLSVHLLWLKSNAWNMPKTSFLLTGSCTESRNCCLLSSLLVKKCLMAVFVVLARNNMFSSVRYTVCTNKNFRQWQSKTGWVQTEKNLPLPYTPGHTNAQTPFLWSRSGAHGRLNPISAFPEMSRISETREKHSGCIFFRYYSLQ